MSECVSAVLFKPSLKVGWVDGEIERVFWKERELSKSSSGIVNALSRINLMVPPLRMEGWIRLAIRSRLAVDFRSARTR